ncbi:dihydrofolate reductase family protein [Gordonia soli]|uniref:Bacterial bifunctional deaminase-reductase C-terminal domain-containing protein n=1 Tax=Gordonia soli NBRC 108243 TaxID=1223545 RepID=M0QD60_9ACTN|nr:dihydrofolate reductase family protein [Gordonia soli]GAC66505.1 hypothetical protein GS4_02_02160 [Gordonia soli NBRC 108243]
MGTLSYGATMSLDGFVADAAGDFQWAAPSAELFDVHVERMAATSTEVLGRRTYALMQYWNAQPADEQWTPAEQEFARRWQGLDKIVVSSTLGPNDLGAEGDRLVSTLELDELRRIVDGARGIVEIFGPTVAADAIRAGLVQEFQFFVVPTVIGTGLRAIPADVRLDLRLVEHRVFDDGVAQLRYVRR